MRHVSFVDRIEIPEVSTTASTNLFLYDVDDDGDVELLIGQWDLGDFDGSGPPIWPMGSLLIVKHGVVWKSCRKLQMVTCVTAGKFCQANKPSIAVLCADGHCYLFNVATSDPIDQAFIVPDHHQLLACNAKDARIMDGNGPCDMAVAYSDRIVRLFGWNGEKREIVLLVKWELAGQIIRISSHSTQESQNLILSSQPGGGFAFLQKKFETYKNRLCPTLVYHPPKRPTNSQSTETRTWVVGDLMRTKAPSNRIALCLADGTMSLMSANLHESETVWSHELSVKGELFGLSRVDLTNDGDDEFVVCCWDGSTYIFNQQKDIVTFSVGQACQAFTSGNMAVSPGVNEPVLIYATLEQSTLIYRNLRVTSLPVFSLQHKLHEDIKLLEKFKAHGVDVSNPVQLRRAIRFLLYEFPQKLRLKKTDTGDPQCE